ncbi:MAG: ABC transporter permease, partial [Devosia sp.]
MTEAAVLPARRLAVDKLGLLIALLVAAGWLLLPFATFKANRIVQGQSRMLFAALPPVEATLLALILAASLPLILLRTRNLLRLATSVVALVALLVLVGRTAAFLTPPGNTLARVSAGAGFGVLVFAYLLLAADALTRLRLNPWP